MTFDDGPSPYTPRLLRTLKEQHATATLFMMGSHVTQYPSTVRAAHALGVEIANHTTDHKQLDLQPSSVVRWELTDTQQRIAKITGEAPSIMRPPYAGRSARTDAISKKLGLAVVTWDVSTVDWENRDPKVVAHLAVSQARPGSIILMHDIHPTTVDAAPAVIRGLRKRGFTLVTVSQLLGNPRPGVVYTAGEHPNASPTQG